MYGLGFKGLRGLGFRVIVQAMLLQYPAPLEVACYHAFRAGGGKSTLNP